MKQTISLLCILSIFLLPLQASAGPDTEDDNVYSPDKLKLKTDTKLILPLLKGSVAPFPGLLVSERKFFELMYASIKLTEVIMKMQLQEKMFTDLMNISNQSLASCQTNLNMSHNQKTPWYKSPYFWFPVGIVLGVVGGVFVYHGAAKLAR